MTWRTMTLVCVLGMTMAAGARAAAPPTPGRLWVPLPGGVANTAGTVGYVANPDGYAEALDLRNGQVLWTSSVPCRPLAVTNGRLVGWVPAPPLPRPQPSNVVITPPPPGSPSNRFCLVVLDAANGQQVWTSKPLTLPEWTDVNLSYAHTFVITAEPCGRVVLLRWEAGACYSGGAAPTPEMLKACRRHQEGGIEFDPVSVSIKTIDHLPPLTALPPAVTTYSRQYGVQTFPVGDSFVAFKGKGWPNAQLIERILLDREGQQLSAVVLMRGPISCVTLSQDCRHAFITEVNHKQGERTPQYVTTAFETATGKRLGRIVPHSLFTTLRTCIGTRAYCIEKVESLGTGPRFQKLVVYDLTTGKILWQRHIWTPPPLVQPC